MKDLIQPHLIDIDTHHTIDFRFERKRYADNISLIMCFRTPVMIQTRQGIEKGHPGDCIIHSPEFPLLHYSEPEAAEGFRNDWLFVEFDAIAPLMPHFELPFNTLIHTEEPGLLESHLEKLQEEINNPDSFSSEAVVRHLEMMLLDIRRKQIQNETMQEKLTSSEFRYYPEFCALRANLIREYSQEIEIRKLAAALSLSPERFTALYRKFFQSSPYADLLDARITAAQRFLCTSGFSIKEIAEACGWTDPYYFSRIFRKRLGVSPQKYRVRYRAGS